MGKCFIICRTDILLLSRIQKCKKNYFTNLFIKMVAKECDNDVDDGICASSRGYMFLVNKSKY